MRKHLFNIILILSLITLLISCSCSCKKDNVDPITNTSESTVIKTDKSIDTYLKDSDYKSIAYAYIYNLKSGLNSYESKTSGLLTAKVLMINYNIDYSSTLIKKNNTFFVKDKSVSSLTNVDSEYYMNSKDKILYSENLKDYNVYNMSDFHKIDYTPDQYTVMGYVFNDNSILKAEIVKNEDNDISIKYTLDTEEATNLSKIGMKNTGGLSDYPKFQIIEMTLNMDKNMMPKGYSIHAIYSASKPILGTTIVTQNASCILSKINEEVVIPNETFYIDKIGGEAIDINTEIESDVKAELLDSLKNIDFGNGSNINGNFIINMENAGIDLNLSINTSTIFDVSKLESDNLYSVLSFYAKLEGNDSMNALMGLVKSFAGEALGEYANLLDDFYGVEIFLAGDGVFYIAAYNENKTYYTVLSVKLVDVLDTIIQKVNVYNLINNSGNDLVEFEKTELDKESDFDVNVILHEDTVNSLKEAIENLFENDTTGMLKSLLGYEEFDSIPALIKVRDNKITELNIKFNYIYKQDEETSLKTLMELTLNPAELSYNFENVGDGAHLFEVYSSTSDIKQKLDWYVNHIYLSNEYITEAQAVVEEYNNLSEEAKVFVSEYKVDSINYNIQSVRTTKEFLKVYYQFDMEHLTNDSIYEILIEKAKLTGSPSLLMNELGEAAYNELSNINNKIDYSVADMAIFKITSTDETTWGLTNDEIAAFNTLFKLNELDSSVSFHIFFQLLMTGSPVSSYDDLYAKVQNLTNLEAN